MEKARKILKQPVCDNCLGRQFSRLLSGYTNEERGKTIRNAMAMEVDASSSLNELDASNFAPCGLRNVKAREAKECSICRGVFARLGSYAKAAVTKAKRIEYSTFLVGTRPSSQVLYSEEALWESTGIDFCEPIKGEINRETGKLIEKLSGKKFSPKGDVIFLIDMESGRVSVSIAPVFIYGEYQKLKRGIPQTKWPSGKYKTSVEQIIAKPYMAATRSKAHKLHGAGREDIDARCLAWRPFVLELLDAKKRNIDVNKLAKRIGKEVRVRNLRFSDIAEVRAIKEMRLDKTYRAKVKCDKPIKRAALKKLSVLSAISQKTPKRVLHRRADLLRRRAVKSVKTRFINSRTFELIVRGESGLYIKELISGDDGRTKPSVSELLGVPCRCTELDVIGVHMKK
ncbi:MAG: tRNA pseudouridine(54/55) synthase Pus10 [Candidatus Aenigmarchaeota archaeon]|nr:tRNA pseudouridine(54/55) synthase Pus10 [Candidatus Aenigmarchaeota archaeon]